MVFLFLIDVITSVTLSIMVRFSTWVLFKSANGLYYLYRRIGSNDCNQSISDGEYIILTREEYDRLSNNQNIIPLSNITSEKDITIN